MFEFGARLDQILVWLGVFDERGRGADFAGEEVGSLGPEFGVAQFCDESFAGAGVYIPRGASGGFAELCSKVAHFGDGMRKQTGHLRLEGARVDDLAEGGIGGQRQQVSCHIEGPRLEGAVVGFGLHLLGTDDALAEGFVNCGGGALVGREKAPDGVAVKVGGGGVGAEVREVPAGFLEVLIAGGAFLAVPALLVDQYDGCKQAQALDGKGDMGQVGDGAVAVLKIECVKELLGALDADFSERFAHGERGP